MIKCQYCMKFKILTFLILLVSFFVVTANGESIKLVIQHADGETTSLKLNDQPVVTFTADDLVATTQTNSVTIPLTNVSQIMYEASQQFVAVDQSIVGGTVSVDNPDAEAGETVTVTVTPNSGFQIAKSDVKAEATIHPGQAQLPGIKAEGPSVGMIIELVGDDPADLRQERTYTFTMPEVPYDVLITATFTPVNYYNVVIADIEHGNVEADKNQAVEGETVNLTVTPSTGYELEELYYMNGDNKVSITGTSFPMPAADVEVHATFKAIDYTITVAESQNGRVEAPETAHYGDEVTLNIIPAEEYELETLTYTVEGAEPVEIENGKFTMPAANVTINATFKAITYKVTVQESQNGNVTSDKQTAAKGETVTLTINPDTEFELDVLTIDGEPVEVTGNTYEFAMPNHDVTVTATFKAVVHTFTVVGEPAALFGSDNAWDVNNENAIMTLGEDGIYTWTSDPTFLEGDVEFKIVKDNSYDTSYPASNYVIPGLKPGTYTVTITLNPETGEITVNVEGSADVYVFGEINGNAFTPNEGVKMTSEDGNIYTATVNITDTENGYSFFAFTHKLGADEGDWSTANYYRFLAQSNGNFLVNGATMNVELPMAYNGDNSMKIPAGDYTLTVDLENMKLTITGGTQLSYILASGVEGVDYTIINDLAVVERHAGTQQFFTSDGNDNWITIKGGEYFADALLADGFKGGHVSGVFSDKNLNPYITLSVAPEEGEDVAAVEPKTYSLANEFAPKVDEVIIVRKAYYKASENTLRAYAPGNNVQGQSLTIDTSLFDYDFRDGKQYTVTGVINIKEPWVAASGIGLMDYDYPFQNYKLLVLDADENDVPTAIDGVFLEEGVKSVRYFNAAGIESNVPFQGVNIIVKEMNDGTIVTTKALIK